MNYLQISKRNLLRNKRRTIISISSIFFAVFLAVCMRSMQLGSYDNIIDSVVNNYSGHIQLHKMGYWDDKTIDNVFRADNNISRLLDSLPEIEYYSKRVESFALASVGKKTKGVALIGIDPLIENKFSKLDKRLIEGKLLDKEKGVIIGSRLARYLNLKVKDTLILLSQGYHGSTAAGKYPVIGIVKLPSPDLDNKFVYINIDLALDFYSLDNRLTSIAIKLKHNSDIASSTIKLKEKLKDKNIEIMQWNEMMPEIEQQIQSDNVSSLIMLGLLYLIVGFGIFGTILMMLSERKREFGVMLALGMRRGRIVILVLIECLEMSIIGLGSGILASLPLIIYFHHHPIPLRGETAEMMEQYGWEAVLKFAFYPEYFIYQSITVLILVAIALIYPIRRILKLDAIRAIKS